MVAVRVIFLFFGVVVLLIVISHRGWIDWNIFFLVAIIIIIIFIYGSQEIHVLYYMLES